MTSEGRQLASDKILKSVPPDFILLHFSPSGSSSTHQGPKPADGPKLQWTSNSDSDANSPLNAGVIKSGSHVEVLHVNAGEIESFETDQGAIQIAAKLFRQSFIFICSATLREVGGRNWISYNGAMHLYDIALVTFTYAHSHALADLTRTPTLTCLYIGGCRTGDFRDRRDRIVCDRCRSGREIPEDTFVSQIGVTIGLGQVYHIEENLQEEKSQTWDTIGTYNRKPHDAD